MSGKRSDVVETWLIAKPMAFGAPSVNRNNTPKIKLANNVYKMFTWKEVI